MATLRQVQTTGKEMPISALILPSNPTQQKYKECIGDGDGTSKDQPTNMKIVVHNDQTTILDEDIREMQEKFNMTDFRAKLRVAEALAQASSMTSPAAKRRLEARKIEMDMNKDQGKPVFLNDENEEYTPPRELLIYIMR